ncbi:unnamed protein product, partial [Musa hybrid cultivar]
MYTSKKIGFSLCFGEFGIEITGFNSQIMLPACCQAIVLKKGWGVIFHSTFHMSRATTCSGSNTQRHRKSRTPNLTLRSVYLQFLSTRTTKPSWPP